MAEIQDGNAKLCHLYNDPEKSLGRSPSLFKFLSEFCHDPNPITYVSEKYRGGSLNIHTFELIIRGLSELRCRTLNIHVFVLIIVEFNGNYNQIEKYKFLLEQHYKTYYFIFHTIFFYCNIQHFKGKVKYESQRMYLDVPNESTLPYYNELTISSLIRFEPIQHYFSTHTKHTSHISLEVSILRKYLK